MGVVENSRGALPEIAKRISSVASEIVTVRTATVYTDSVDPKETMVVLDNDPSQTPINAFGLNFAMPKGTRVVCLAYPPRGLVILGAFAALSAVLDPPGVPASYGAGTFEFTEAQAGGATQLYIRCVGGGGAGGGARATAAGQDSVGGGGQAGHYAENVVRVSDLTFPLQVIGGAAGVPVSAGNGGNGGLSRVRDNAGAGSILCEAGGGEGGTASAPGGAGTQAAGGRAAPSGVGTLVTAGAPGFPGGVPAANQPMPGYGGNGPWGGGGSLLGFLGNLQGQSGVGYGAGGAGSSRRASQTALAGGPGQIGGVFIIPM